MKSKKRKNIPLILRRPADTHIPELPYSKAELHEARTREARRQLDGLSILAKHYGIRIGSEDSSWRAVLLELARDVLPYFQPGGRQPPGPPKRWTRQELLRLWTEIQFHRTLNSLTVDEACEVAGRTLYPDSRFIKVSKYPTDVIQARYKDACAMIKLRPDIPGVREFERQINQLRPVKRRAVQR